MIRMATVLVKYGQVSHSLDDLKMAKLLVKPGEVLWVDLGLLAKLTEMETSVAKATLPIFTMILRLPSLEPSRMASW